MTLMEKYSNDEATKKKAGMFDKMVEEAKVKNYFNKGLAEGMTLAQLQALQREQDIVNQAIANENAARYKQETSYNGATEFYDPQAQGLAETASRASLNPNAAVEQEAYINRLNTLNGGLR